MSNSMWNWKIIHNKALTIRDAVNQHAHAAALALKHFTADSAVILWNIIAGDDIRTLAGHHPLSAKIIAGIDLASNVTLPEDKVGILAAKEAAKTVEHLGIDAAKQALEKGLQNQRHRVSEPAFYDGKFHSYGRLTDSLGAAGKNHDWHHGVPQKLKDYGVPVHEINNIHGMYPIHRSDHTLLNTFQKGKEKYSTALRMHKWGEDFKTWKLGNPDKPMGDFLQDILKENDAFMRSKGMNPEKLNAEALSRWEHWKSAIIQAGKGPKSFYHALEKGLQAIKTLEQSHSVTPHHAFVPVILAVPKIAQISPQPGDGHTMAHNEREVCAIRNDEPCRYSRGQLHREGHIISMNDEHYIHFQDVGGTRIAFNREDFLRNTENPAKLAADLHAAEQSGNVLRLTYPLHGKVEAQNLGSRQEHAMRQGHGLGMRIKH